MCEAWTPLDILKLHHGFFDVGTAISYNMQCINVKEPFGAHARYFLADEVSRMAGPGRTAKHLLCAMKSWPTQCAVTQMYEKLLDDVHTSIVMDGAIALSSSTLTVALVRLYRSGSKRCDRHWHVGSTYRGFSTLMDSLKCCRFDQRDGQAHFAY